MRRGKRVYLFIIAAAVFLLNVTLAHGGEPQVGEMQADRAALEKRFGQRPYSPWAESGFPRQVYWGDTHLHTGLSMDAGLFGARLGLEDAYRFARGDQVVSSTGQPVKLSRPLDWLVIADHSDGMGLVNDLAAATPEVTRFEQGARWSKGMRAGGQKAVDTAMDLIGTFSQGKVDPELLGMYSPGSKIYASVWDKVVEAAEAYNDPGTFSTLIGSEWTSLVMGSNLHRNVIFRDNADKAGQVVPYTTQEPIGSTDPLKLYEWMTNYEAKTGGTVLALAHNGNLSLLMRSTPAASLMPSMLSSGPNGNQCMRLPRSRVMVKRIHFFLPMMPLPTMKHGTQAIWI
jgi:hypothetical protein